MATGSLTNAQASNNFQSNGTEASNSVPNGSSVQPGWSGAHASSIADDAIAALASIYRHIELAGALNIQTSGFGTTIPSHLGQALLNLGLIDLSNLIAAITSLYSECGALPEKPTLVEYFTTRLPGSNGFLLIDRILELARQSMSLAASKQLLTDFLRRTMCTEPLIAAVHNWPSAPSHVIVESYLEQTQENATAISAWSHSASWPDPRPLTSACLPEFPTARLPRILRAWVDATATSTQTPPDLAGSLTLAVVSAACAKRYAVHVREDWQEQLNLYVVAAMPSGSRKSAVFREALRPIEELQTELIESSRCEVEQRKSERRSLENRLRAAERANGRGTDRRSAESARDLAAELARFPKVAEPLLKVEDFSPEKLEMILAEQGGRILAASAESSVFESVLGKRYSDSANYQLILKAHNGDPLRTDRVGRDSVAVESPALSIACTVQPEVIQQFGKYDEYRSHGLLARFLFVLPADLVGNRSLSAPSVPASIRQEYHSLIRRLYDQSFIKDVSVHGRKPSQPSLLRLDEGADRIFQDMRGRIEAATKADGDLSKLRDFAGKLAGTIARLAGILHLAADAGSCSATGNGAANSQRRRSLNPARYSASDHVISSVTMENAIFLGEKYFLPHAIGAFRLMGLRGHAHSEGVNDAEYILDWIRRGRRHQFSKRELHSNCRTRFRRSTDIDGGLDLLVDHDYLRTEEMPTQPSGGRPTIRYLVNPAAYR